MHEAAFSYVVARLRELSEPPHRVVEIGSRNVNGSVRELFSAGTRYLGIDVASGPGVDLLADGATFTPRREPDLVVCCEVLEHTPAACDIVANAHRMLAPGGAFIATMAGPGREPHSASDGHALRTGEFYRNVEPATLQGWLGVFSRHSVVCNPEAGDVYCTAWKETRPAVRGGDV